MTSSYRVHMLRPLAPKWLSVLLTHLAPEVELTNSLELPDPPDCHVLVDGRPTREQVVASPFLRAIVVPFAGVPVETRELMRDFPQVSVFNLHHNAAHAAELTLTLLMAVAKRVVPADRALRAGDWRVRYGSDQGELIAGKTALILGYGAIGQRVARLCQGIGMRVLAIRRSGGSTEAPGTHEIYGPEKLHALLPRANALIVCLPLTTDTEGLIGGAELALLPRGAILVNIGRAAIIDEAALFEALRSGGLGGAGLDVWYNYPESEADRAYTRPTSYPLHELDNVVMTPHLGGAFGGDSVEALRVTALAQLLNSLAAGVASPKPVDLDLGY